MKKILLFSFIVLTVLSISSQEAYSQDFEIKHADSLEASENEILISGGILVTYETAVIMAEKAVIFSDADGKAEKAIFLGTSKIELNDRNIQADKITVYLNTKLISAEGNTTSKLINKDKTEILIKADYQELNWEGENTKAAGNIKTNYQDTEVLSDKAEIIYKGTKPDKAIFYSTNKSATLSQKNHLTRANAFTFDIATKDVTADENVESIIWPYTSQAKEQQNKISVTTDNLYLNHLSEEATAKSHKNKVKLTYEDTYGESNEAVLVRNKINKKPP